MTDTVRVPKAFSDWLYGVEGYGLRVERLSEELRDPVDKLLPWLLAAFEVGLAASPQGEGSSADADTPQPDALPGDLREKVRGAMKAWAQEDCSTGLKMMLTPKGFCDLETRILSLIQSERGGA